MASLTDTVSPARRRAWNTAILSAPSLAFASGPDAAIVIRRYTKEHNGSTKPLVRAKAAEAILAKLRRLVG